MDLITTTRQPDMWAISALPSGHAFLHTKDNKYRILWLNSNGQTLYQVYDCICYIETMLILGQHFYLFTRDVRGVSRITQKQLNTGQIIQIFSIPDVNPRNKASSYFYNHDQIRDEDILILFDVNQKEVFTYNALTKEKEVKLNTEGQQATSITYGIINNQTFYLVCLTSNDSVNLYDSRWRYVRTLGGYGQLSEPITAFMSPEGTVIVGDSGHFRVSEYTLEGELICHLLDKSDGLFHLRAVSFTYPHIWIISAGDTETSTRRYRMYKNDIL